MVFTTILAIPMSRYMAWIMDGRYNPPAFLRWFEKRLDSGGQNWKQYAAALLIFNTAMFIYGYIVLAVQPIAPLNPRGLGMLAPTTIFDSVASFMTNYQPSTLFGGPALIELESNFLRNLESVRLCRRRTLRANCDYPLLSRGEACRQFFRRYVAGRGLHVRSRGLRSRHPVCAAGDADDLRKHPSGLDARTCLDGDD